MTNHMSYDTRLAPTHGIVGNTQIKRSEKRENGMYIYTQLVQRFKRSGRTAVSAESGQAIDPIALIMVGLLATLGVAINGCGPLFLWRDAQNATDAAVLAAAYAICTNGNPTTAGLEAAEQNGFDNNGIDNTVTVENPLTTGPKAGDPNYVYVGIEADSGPLHVNTHALGFCRRAINPAIMPGLWSGSTDCQDGINWTGLDGEYHGSMYSRNDIKLHNTNVYDLDSADGITDKVEAGGIIDKNPGTVINPPVTEVQDAADRSDPLDYEIEDFNEGGAIYESMPASDRHIIDSVGDAPGYSCRAGKCKWNVPNTYSLKGLYYVKGEIETAQQNTWEISDGGGVTLVATGPVTIHLGSDHAPIKNYEGAAGLLALSTYDVEGNCSLNAIKVTGHRFDITGVFYAPRGGIELQGSDYQMVGALIGWVLNFSGSKGEFWYEPGLIPPHPPYIGTVE